jgi:hypothetical protein
VSVVVFSSVDMGKRSGLLMVVAYRERVSFVRLRLERKRSEGRLLLK